MIVGLASETGKSLKNMYGKVISYNTANDRFGVRMKCGQTVAIRRQNLEMEMTNEEMSEEDENLLLALEPCSEDIRGMPFEQRINALYGCEGKNEGSE
mmetsp:Transcript_14456/g.22662  ORF Transcript_14456/g.22662 Transcript_14456/m.22662 type:complete len:98 (-) Transcript_14456:336-629(-)